MNAIVKWKIIRIVLTMIHLMAGWLLFTGTVAAFPLLLGLFFSTIVAFLTYHLFIDVQEVARRALIPRIYLLIGYLILIVVKVYVASFRIAWKVITGNITPRIVHFRSRLRSDLARVALANSITLTPGTLTLDLDEDHLVVHWLEASTTHSGYAARLIARPFERWLRRIWV
ncbi:MAG: Na+/H+ antiporter subunit E [Spirochaetaceae bacterium]|nr:MAG: Na+/H+ antiporter subunit E [Spirochaetaceae bacterium]